LSGVAPTARGWHGPTEERLQLAERVADLRSRRLTYREIASALGISHQYASDLFHDPTGEKARARKDSYAQPCVDCGVATSGGEGMREEPRCLPCAAIKSGAERTLWTREEVISSIRWWADKYGEQPSAPDFDPWRCRYVLYDGDREVRARRHLDAGDIPWFTTVVKRFGTWNAALAAAGFKPRANHGGAGNQERRWRRWDGLAA